MSPANVPLWAAFLVVLLALAGAGLSLIGAFGLIRLKNFYERVHAPTLGATLGMALIMASSVLLLSITEGHLVMQEILIGVFLTVTTPVTLILLARAAAHRDRHENNPGAPPKM